MKKIYIIIAILIISVLIVSGCGGECSSNSDCESKKCQTARCSDDVCEYQIKPNCCGNLDCEENENKCTCALDCGGECSGKVTWLNQRGKEKEADYLEQLCEEDLCVYSVKKESVQLKTKIDEPTLEGSLFELEIITKYNSPFKIGVDSFNVVFKLKNTREDFVSPLKITRIKFIQDDDLFGQKDANIQLRKIGDEMSLTVPSNADLKLPEEEISLSMKFDYTAKRMIDSNVQEIRSSDTNKFGEKLFMLETGEVK